MKNYRWVGQQSRPTLEGGFLSMSHPYPMNLQPSRKRRTLAPKSAVSKGLKRLLAANSKLVGMRGAGSPAGIIFCLLACLEFPPALANQPLPRSVLVIDQFESASRASAAVLSSLRSTLRGSSDSTISIYIENLDLGRFGGARFNDVVQTYVREKYRDKPIGAILPVGSAALELVLHLRPQLWADTPVIFAAVEATPDGLTLPPKVTGKTILAPLSGSAAIARAIVPGLKRIAIVGDPPERQFIRQDAAAQLELLATRFDPAEPDGRLLGVPLSSFHIHSRNANAV